MTNSSIHRKAWRMYWLLVTGAVLVLLVSTAQASQTTPSIIVDISIIQSTNSSHERVAFIMLSNIGIAPAELLNLSIESVDGPIGDGSFSSLAGGQSQVIQITIPPSDVEQLILKLQYWQEAIEHSQVKLIELKSSSYGNSSYLKVLLPAIFGSMITLISIVVTSFLATKRESVRAKFEWGKFLFECYEQYYQQFISAVAGTLDANQINEYFRRLNKSAFVPNHLRLKVKETSNTLKSAISIDQKEIARDNLLKEFEQFVENYPFLDKTLTE